MKKASDFFDKIPDNLKSRIYTEEMPTKQRLLPLIKAMVKGIAVEFLYKTKDGDEIYVLTAPICLKEFEKHWYLLGDNNDDDAGIRIYALNKIRSFGEE
ncbi:MAG: WYL domain-containing protein [Prevotella sp.]|nr:WYL domain-containing protein [Prevotella sp.]